MTIDREKLTAYALDELEGTERDTVEKQVAENDEARAYVDAIRETAGRIATGLSAEPEEGLSGEQRARIHSAVASSESSLKKKPWLIRRNLVPAAVAALVLVAATVVVAQLYSWLDIRFVTLKNNDGTLASAPRDSGRIRGMGYMGPSDASPKQNLGRMGYGAGIPESVRENLKSLGYGDSYDYDYEEEEIEEVIETATDRLRGTWRLPGDLNTEQYDHIAENVFLETAKNRLSTFSIDVDTASYSNVRRFLLDGRLPPRDAVRIEELVNYFPYDYAPPEGEVPFSANVEIAACPWNLEHRLARIGLKGRTIERDARPRTNLVFLLDVSGSMDSPNKLPLVKKAMRLLVDRLDRRDSIAIAVYAGSSGLVLPPTHCGNKRRIRNALSRLSAGGSTNGGAGIELAYRTATGAFIEGGVNRVILCTDGDFNVGVTDDGSLVKMIERKAKSGVFLSVLGFGMGNYKDSKMEKLADRGNGNYAYIDNALEAKKILCYQMEGTLVTIAKDVKIQVDFNPAKVAGYRLIGYENRKLRKEDFNNDRIDAGEIGAGHTVTALYELVPFGKVIPTAGVDPSRYEKPAGKVGDVPEEFAHESFFVKLRYKEPDGDTSRLASFPVTDDGRGYGAASPDFKFAASVASFGMILRDSRFKGTASCDAVIELAGEGIGADQAGYRKAFLDLARKAKRIIAQR